VGLHDGGGCVRLMCVDGWMECGVVMCARVGCRVCGECLSACGVRMCVFWGVGQSKHCLCCLPGRRRFWWWGHWVFQRILGLRLLKGVMGEG
jgi:hypothetical protein